MNTVKILKLRLSFNKKKVIIARGNRPAVFPALKLITEPDVSVNIDILGDGS
jgi:hypothetical protein